MEFFNTHISNKSIILANKVLESGWISEGKIVKKFESELSKKLGLVYPVALNSGTSALHLALVLAGVGPDDEVILPAQTFVATGLVILMQRAKPIFADIDPLTGNVSTESIMKKITKRTKAVMPVHWGGYPCDMDEINKTAKENNMAVIEDAAHALGATYKCKPIGSISRFTAFSFQAIKHLTTGDGGALCCLNKKDSRDAFCQRWFGIDRAGSKPSILGERVYDINKIGFKYHMNDLAAAIGLGNLANFYKRLRRRQKIGNYYRDNLEGIKDLKLLNFNRNRTSAFWFFTILVERREDFIRKLSDNDIPSSVVHLGIDKNSIFGGIKEDLLGQRYFNDKQIAIPIHEGLSDKDVIKIVKVIKSGW